MLLLISAQGRIPDEISEFTQRRGLEVRRLQGGDDLDTLLARLQPAALAWDVAGSSQGDWVMVQRLRKHPLLAQIPFTLYVETEDAGATGGMMDVVVKPVSSKTLREEIEKLQPSGATGPILIVDDEPQARESCLEVVGAALPAYDVCTAENGAVALDILARQVPSLVILDLMMPEVDGFEVLERMRSDPRTSSVPVLILSNRLLTFEDVKRLGQYSQVTFHSKGILSESEAASSMHQALFGTDSLPPHTSALVKQAVAYFHQNYDHPLSNQDVAKAIGANKRYLSRVFCQELGLSLKEYLNRYRVLRAKDLLRRSDDSIADVALKVGFEDPAYFSRVFRKLSGLSPSAYRKGAE